MSEQEKKSGGTAIGTSVIMVEKTASSRHKQPYRPTELQDDTDLHHKRSKAPVVPSVAEELKTAAEDIEVNENADIDERKEFIHGISSEKHKHNVGKKIESSTKKREPSPESITLATLEVDKKPILADVESDFVAAEKEAAKKANEDSITDEITEMRTPEVAKKHSEWSDDQEAGGLPRSDSRASRVSRMVRQFFCCGMAYEAPSEDNNTRSPMMKKKGITWNDSEYQQKVVLKETGARSEVWMLDRKASVGPCFRPDMPFEGPSGIMICLPKKSTKCITCQPSGISINISRKCLLTKSKSAIEDIKKLNNDKYNEKEKSEKVNCEAKLTNCVSNIREKITSIHSRIRSAFHM